MSPHTWSAEISDTGITGLRAAQGEGDFSEMRMVVLKGGDPPHMQHTYMPGWLEEGAQK